MPDRPEQMTRLLERAERLLSDVTAARELWLLTIALVTCRRIILG